MCLSGRCSICRDKEKGRAAELRGEAPFFRVEMDEDLIEDCVRRGDHLRIYDDLTCQLAEARAEIDQLIGERYAMVTACHVALSALGAIGAGDGLGASAIHIAIAIANRARTAEIKKDGSDE